MLSLLLFVLTGGGLLFTALGLFTAYHLLRPQRAPADVSNRINAIRLWWFALTREDEFVGFYPWLRRDESENV